MRRFKVMAALTVALAVGAGATLATVGSAKSKGEDGHAGRSPGPVQVGNGPGMVKVRNLSDKDVGLTVKCLDDNDQSIQGCGGSTSCSTAHTCELNFNPGPNQQDVVPVLCVSPKDAAVAPNLVFAGPGGVPMEFPSADWINIPAGEVQDCAPTAH